MSTRANPLKIEAVHPATAADMLQALIKANQAHARAIEAVKMRLELEAAQARER
jgi:hypothetical protein